MGLWSFIQKLLGKPDVNNGTIPKEEIKTEDDCPVVGDNYYVCNECDKKISASSSKVRFCTRCMHWYCLVHFDNHFCIPSKKRKKLDIVLEHKMKMSCEFCDKGIDDLNSYFCKYCKRWFCEKHRLPENHKCIGKPKNNLPPAGRINYSKDKTEYFPK